MKLNNEQFNILREISKNPSKSQRELAKQFNNSVYEKKNSRI
jgi:DNA-binding MarR family transcriptional regulator